jgi:hypothetical protein
MDGKSCFGLILTLVEFTCPKNSTRMNERILTIEAKEKTLMKGKWYTEEQIINVLQGIEAGKTVSETCRKYNVSENTVYRWHPISM